MKRMRQPWGEMKFDMKKFFEHAIKLFDQSLYWIIKDSLFIGHH